MVGVRGSGDGRSWLERGWEEVVWGACWEMMERERERR